MSVSKLQAVAVILLFFCIPFSFAEQAVQVQPRVTGPIDSARRVTLRGNTHPLARPRFDRGAAPDQQPLDRMLLLLKRAPEQEAALRELLDEQQTKSSPDFHHWLTPQEFGARFGPADADVQAVAAWLESRGFQVSRLSAGRTVIEFSGSAGQVRSTFHTEIHNYAVNGGEYWANARDPQIPEALAAVVAGFASLNNFPRKPFTHVFGTFRRYKDGRVEPEYTFSSGNGTYYALAPTDFGTIYNLLPLWKAGYTGTGQTIAIVSDSNINLADSTDFGLLFHLTPNNPEVILDGPDPGLTSSETEADTDTQWAHAAAQNATIKLVVAEDTETTAGIDLAALYIIDNNIAPVMSVSYGECEADLGQSGNAFYNSLWEQGASEGITIIVAAGDSGSATCDGNLGEVAAQDGLAVSGQASTPYNVAMGGTDFNDSTDASTYWGSTENATTWASALSYIPETTWNDSCAQQGLAACQANAVLSDGSDLEAGGGGPSACGLFGISGSCAGGYPKPSWQVGAGVPNDHVRDLPDFAMFSGNGAASSFYIVCETDFSDNGGCSLDAPHVNFVGIGGTSVPTPAFAGIMALVNQKIGGRQGNANYVLYKLAAQSGASCSSDPSAVGNQSCIFYDVNTGNNSVACQVDTPDCNAGTTSYGALVTSNSSSDTTLAWTTGAGYDLATGLGSVNAANLVNNWHSVTFNPSTTTLSLSPTTLTHGQAVQFTINVTGSSGAPQGSVTLEGAPGNTKYGIANFALSGGAATGSTELLPGGTYTVTARYGGSGTYGASASSPPISVTVGKESSKTTVGLVTFDLNGNVISSNAASAAYGSPYILRSDVTNAAGQSCASAAVACPTGKVTLTDNGGPLDLSSYVLNSQGYFEDQPIQFNAGSHSVVASYAGDNSFLASSSPAVPMTISKAATDTYAPSTLNGDGTVSYGSTIKLVVDVTTQSSGVAPTGTVQFLNGAKPVSGTISYTGYSAAISSTGYALLQATLTTSPSANEGLNISYSGDSNYAASSGSFIFYVNPGIVVSAAPTSLNIAAPGGSASSTASMKFGGGTFSGPINFNCDIPYNMLATACSFSPAGLSAAGKTTVTITTTGSGMAPPLPRIPPAGLILLAAVPLAFLALARRRRWNPAAALLLCALAAAIVVACGGGSGSGGGGSTTTTTPAGTYTVGVVASGTSGGNSVSGTANLTVTVQ